mmetsp:Transcript_30844/g.56517  ORF Transcript_30844/g.56517 Transcript_30844/m.56517 type:complete len:236 (+) Transcript_30844:669-1376(+)
MTSVPARMSLLRRLMRVLESERNAKPHVASRRSGALARKTARIRQHRQTPATNKLLQKGKRSAKGAATRAALRSCGPRQSHQSNSRRQGSCRLRRRPCSRPPSSRRQPWRCSQALTRSQSTKLWRRPKQQWQLSRARQSSHSRHSETSCRNSQLVRSQANSNWRHGWLQPTACHLNSRWLFTPRRLPPSRPSSCSNSSSFTNTGNTNTSAHRLEVLAALLRDSRMVTCRCSCAKS